MGRRLSAKVHPATARMSRNDVGRLPLPQHILSCDFFAVNAVIVVVVVVVVIVIVIVIVIGIVVVAVVVAASCDGVDPRRPFSAGIRCGSPVLQCIRS
jgi:hypothetical protein